MSPDDTRRLRSKRETRETLISLLILEDKGSESLVSPPRFWNRYVPRGEEFLGRRAINRTLEIPKEKILANDENAHGWKFGRALCCTRARNS